MCGEPGHSQSRVASQPEAGVQMSLFGPPLLRWASAITAFLPERRLQLPVLLAMRAGEWVARVTLAALLWPERSSGHGRRNRRQTLLTARSIAGTKDVGAMAALLSAELALRHCTRAQRHSNATSTRAFGPIRQIRP